MELEWARVNSVDFHSNSRIFVCDLKMFKFIVLFALLFVALGDNMMDPNGVTPIGDKEKVLGE